MKASELNKAISKLEVKGIDISDNDLVDSSIDLGHGVTINLSNYGSYRKPAKIAAYVVREVGRRLEFSDETKDVKQLVKYINSALSKNKRNKRTK